MNGESLVAHRFLKYLEPFMHFHNLLFIRSDLHIHCGIKPLVKLCTDIPSHLDISPTDVNPVANSNPFF